MVQQTIQFDTDSPSEIGSGTITAFLFSGATLVATLASIAENATRKGRHTGTVTDVAAGAYDLVVKFNGYTSNDAGEVVDLLLEDGTYVSYRAAELDSASLDEIKGPGWDEDTDTLKKIRDAIASFSTTTIVIPTPIPEVVGMPETLEIGDSYDDETPIKLYVRDDADDPVTSFSGHDLADLDFAPTFTIAPTPGSARGRVVGTVTYVPASGPDEGYLKVEIPSLQSRRAVEGESSVQCVLKWDGYEKTLLSTTVRWLPRV